MAAFQGRFFRMAEVLFGLENVGFAPVPDDFEELLKVRCSTS
jgi:hypothetical protein